MKKRKTKQLIGATDYLALPEFGLESIACKVDSGAYTSTLHCSDIWLLEKEEEIFLCFKLYAPNFNINTRKTYKFQNFKTRNVRSSNGSLDERFSIRTPVVIFGRKTTTEFTLSSRSKMRYPILLGRRFLRGRYLIDVSKKNLSYIQKETNKETQL